MILGASNARPTASAGAASDAVVDLTPVIDMVFLLLIFFLAATTFQQAEREIAIALPKTAAATPISAAMREIVINVAADGRTIVAGRAVDAASLRAMVAAAVTANREQKVSVRADRAVAYDHVAQVLDLCKGAGVATPFLDTAPRNAE